MVFRKCHTRKACILKAKKPLSILKELGSVKHFKSHIIGSGTWKVICFIQQHFNDFPKKYYLRMKIMSIKSVDPVYLPSCKKKQAMNHLHLLGNINKVVHSSITITSKLISTLSILLIQLLMSTLHPLYNRSPVSTSIFLQTFAWCNIIRHMCIRRMRARRRPDRVLEYKWKESFAKKGTKKSSEKSERTRKALVNQLCIMHSFCTLFALIMHNA